MVLVTYGAPYLITSVAYPNHFLAVSNQNGVHRVIASNRQMQCWYMSSYTVRENEMIYALRPIAGPNNNVLHYAGIGRGYLTISPDAGAEVFIGDPNGGGAVSNDNPLYWLTLTEVADANSTERGSFQCVGFGRLVLTCCTRHYSISQSGAGAFRAGINAPDDEPLAPTYDVVSNLSDNPPTRRQQWKFLKMPTPPPGNVAA